ncbi:MAG: hypothetical protein QM778_03750 [Myxococcales bacterium]
MHASRWLCLTTLLWLLAGGVQAQSQPAVGTCLGGNCQVGSPALPQQDAQQEVSPPRGFARGAAWFGLLSGALTLAGSVTIASVHDQASEPITRGVWMGYTALALPVVALGSFTTRKRARVDGLKPLRGLGWTAYAGAVTNGAAQFYLVLNDSRPSAGFTVGLGVISLMAFLPHAFDAFVSYRSARSRGFALAPTSSGFVVRF